MKRKYIFRTAVSLLICLSLAVPSLADVLTLPACVKVIEEEAFYGDDSIDEVVLPEGIEVIGERAFADSGLSRINLPSSLTSVGDNAFDGTGEVAFDISETGAGHDWAVNHWIRAPHGQATNGAFLCYGISGSLSTNTLHAYDISSGSLQFRVNAASVEALRQLSSEGYTEIRYAAYGLSEAPDFSDETQITRKTGALYLSAKKDMTSFIRQATSAYVNSTGIITIAENHLSQAPYCVVQMGFSKEGETVPSLWGSYAFWITGRPCGIIGRVVDSATGEGIEGVTVSCNDYSTVSGEDGSYMLEIPSGTHILHFSLDGYIDYDQEMTVTEDESTVEDTVILSEWTEQDENEGHNGHRYQIFRENITWSQAREACEQKGGHLATITSRQEQKHIDSLNSSQARLWIGGYKVDQNRWAWVTGEPWGYTNWGSGEPNDSPNVISGENRVSVWPSYWNDLNDQNVYETSGYICEWDDYDEVNSLSDFTFTENGDGSCTLTAYTGNATRVIIPAFNQNGCNVRRIGENAFAHNGTVQTVIIPDTVAEIAEWAFFDCSNLKNVTLSDTLQIIGIYAFKDCISIERMHFPDTLYSIAIWAFEGCSSLSEINYPVGWTEKPDYGVNHYSPFAGCLSLKELIIPEGIAVIPDNAFYGANCLTRVSLPDSLCGIGPGVFRETGLEQIDIPRNVTVIGEAAFETCTLLEQVNLKEGLNSIEMNAFCGCIALKQIHFPDSLHSIAIWAFDGCGLTEINYPAGWRYKADYGVNHYSPFTSCGELTRIEIPEGVTSIPEYAFMGMESLQEVILPSSLTQIGKGVFMNCSQLSGIILPFGLKYINERAFYNTALLRVAIPSTVDSIDYRAFASCGGLAGISIPAGVGSVADDFVNQDKPIYAVPGTAIWQSLADMGYEDNLVEWDGTTDPFDTDTAGQFITFLPCDFIAAGEEVTSCKSGGDIVSRVQYHLTPGMALPVPYVTDGGAVKVTVKLRYWNEDYGYYYTYLDANEEVMATSNWDFENDGAGNKTGILDLRLPQHIRTGLYVLQMWSRNEYGTTVDARVQIRIDGDQWTGYVQGERANTFASSSATSPNGYVDNLDPVEVIGEDGGRYKIIMILTAGGTAERWVDKQLIKDTYLPWNGYIQGKRVLTHEDAVSTVSNGYVDHMDPVKVIGVEGNRLKIRMQVTEGIHAGETAERWVDKSYVSKVIWVNNNAFRSIGIGNGYPGQLRAERYDVSILSEEKFDTIVISSVGGAETVNCGDQVQPDEHGLYHYSGSVKASSESVMNVFVTGYREAQRVASGKTTVYIYEDANSWDAWYSGEKPILEEPRPGSKAIQADIRTNLTVIGQYPSFVSPEYYYVSFSNSDGMMELGFVPVDCTCEYYYDLKLASKTNLSLGTTYDVVFHYIYVTSVDQFNYTGSSPVITNSDGSDVITFDVVTTVVDPSEEFTIESFNEKVVKVTEKPGGGLALEALAEGCTALFFYKASDTSYSIGDLNIVVRSSTNQSQQNQVFMNDGEHYGGDQGHPRFNINQYDEIRRILRRNLGTAYPADLDTDGGLYDYLNAFNDVGCGYVALANAILNAYIWNPELFREKFGFALRDGDDFLNFDLMMIDIYSRFGKNMPLDDTYMISYWLEQLTRGFASKDTICQVLDDYSKAENFSYTFVDISRETARERAQSGLYSLVSVTETTGHDTYFWLNSNGEYIGHDLGEKQGHWMTITGYEYDENGEGRFIISTYGKIGYLYDVERGWNDEYYAVTVSGE